MENLQEPEIIALAGKTGFSIKLYPTDESLGRWNLAYRHRGKNGWLITWRGARRSWASSNTAARWVRDHLGKKEVELSLYAALPDTQEP